MRFKLTGLTFFTEYRTPIRSFVRRQGRITPSQKLALHTWLARYEFSPNQSLLQAFGREAPCILEIGFGMGHALVEMASRHPEQNYVGIEVHTPGIGALLMAIQKHRLPNIRISTQDAVTVVSGLPDASFDAVYLFFPDPWPKKRHLKRRLVQPTFVEQIARVLTPHGVFHMATDSAPYAQHILSVLDAFPAFRGGIVPRPPWRPWTKFEQRGQRLGHRIWDIVYRRREIDGMI